MRLVTDLSDLSDEALWCRTEGHNFQWLTDVVTTTSRGRLLQIERHMECDRCGAPAKRVIDARTWEVSPRKIGKYPEGYLLKGQGRPGRSEVFHEQFRRMH